jgi:hypothetical protein
MRGWQARHGEICAGSAHWIAKTTAVDAVHLIEVAVDEQNRLRQAAAMGRRARVGDVGIVVEVPRAGRAKAMGLDMSKSAAGQRAGSGSFGGARCAAPKRPPLRVTIAFGAGLPTLSGSPDRKMDARDAALSASRSATAASNCLV